MANWSTTFILGSGPSARGVNTCALRPHGMVLGVNEAFFHSRCDAFFSIDRKWMVSADEQGLVWQRVHERAQSLRCADLHLCIKLHQEWPPLPNARLWIRTVGPPSIVPSTLSTGLVQAGSSGQTAINLAMQMGALRVFLLGFDMHQGKYGFWFKKDVHPKGNVPQVLANFEDCAAWYAKRSLMKIYNVNPDSAINGFPKISRDAMMHMLEEKESL